MVEGLALHAVEQQETNEEDIFPKPNFVFDVIEANRDLLEAIKEDPNFVQTLIETGSVPKGQEILSPEKENLRLILGYLKDKEIRAEFVDLLKTSEVLELVKNLEKRLHISDKAKGIVIRKYKELKPNLKEKDITFELISKQHPLFVQFVIQHNEEIFVARNYHGWSASGEIADYGVGPIQEYFKIHQGKKIEDIPLVIDTTSTLLYDTVLTEKGESIKEHFHEVSKPKVGSYDNGANSTFGFVEKDNERFVSLDNASGPLSDTFAALIDLEAGFYKFNRGFMLIAGHSTGARVAENLAIYTNRTNVNTEVIELAPAMATENSSTRIQSILLKQLTKLGDNLNSFSPVSLDPVIQRIASLTTHSISNDNPMQVNLFRRVVSRIHGEKVQKKTKAVIEQIGVWNSNRLPLYYIPSKDGGDTISSHEYNTRLALAVAKFKNNAQESPQTLNELIDRKTNFIDSIENEILDLLDTVLQDTYEDKESTAIAFGVINRILNNSEKVSQKEKPISRKTQEKVGELVNELSSNNQIDPLIEKEQIKKKRNSLKTFIENLKKSDSKLSDLLEPNKELKTKIRDFMETNKIDPVLVLEHFIALVTNENITPSNLQGLPLLPDIIVAKRDQIVNINDSAAVNALRNNEVEPTSRPKENFFSKILNRKEANFGHYGPVENFRKIIQKMYGGLSFPIYDPISIIKKWSGDSSFESYKEILKLVIEDCLSKKVPTQINLLKLMLIGTTRPRTEQEKNDYMQANPGKPINPYVPLNDIEMNQLAIDAAQSILIKDYPTIPLSIRFKIMKYIKFVLNKEGEDRKAKLQKESIKMTALTETQPIQDTEISSATRFLRNLLGRTPTDEEINDVFGLPQEDAATDALRDQTKNIKEVVAFGITTNEIKQKFSNKETDVINRTNKEIVKAVDNLIRKNIEKDSTSTTNEEQLERTTTHNQNTDIYRYGRILATLKVKGTSEIFQNEKGLILPGAYAVNEKIDESQITPNRMLRLNFSLLNHALDIYFGGNPDLFLESKNLTVSEFKRLPLDVKIKILDIAKPEDGNEILKLNKLKDLYTETLTSQRISQVGLLSQELDKLESHVGSNKVNDEFKNQFQEIQQACSTFLQDKTPTGDLSNIRSAKGKKANSIFSKLNILISEYSSSGNQELLGLEDVNTSYENQIIDTLMRSYGSTWERFALRQTGEIPFTKESRTEAEINRLNSGSVTYGERIKLLSKEQTQFKNLEDAINNAIQATLQTKRRYKKNPAIGQSIENWQESNFKSIDTIGGSIASLRNGEGATLVPAEHMIQLHLDIYLDEGRQYPLLILLDNNDATQIAKGEVQIELNKILGAAAKLKDAASKYLEASKIGTLNGFPNVLVYKDGKVGIKRDPASNNQAGITITLGNINFDTLALGEQTEASEERNINNEEFEPRQRFLKFLLDKVFEDKNDGESKQSLDSFFDQAIKEMLPSLKGTLSQAEGVDSELGLFQVMLAFASNPLLQKINPELAGYCNEFYTLNDSTLFDEADSYKKPPIEHGVSLIKQAVTELARYETNDSKQPKSWFYSKYKRNTESNTEKQYQQIVNPILEKFCSLLPKEYLAVNSIAFFNKHIKLNKNINFANFKQDSGDNSLKRITKLSENKMIFGTTAIIDLNADQSSVDVTVRANHTSGDGRNITELCSNLENLMELSSDPEVESLFRALVAKKYKLPDEQDSTDLENNLLAFIWKQKTRLQGKIDKESIPYDLKIQFEKILNLPNEAELDINSLRLADILKAEQSGNFNPQDVSNLFESALKLKINLDKFALEQDKIRKATEKGNKILGFFDQYSSSEENSAAAALKDATRYVQLITNQDISRGFDMLHAKVKGLENSDKGLLSPNNKAILELMIIKKAFIEAAETHFADTIKEQKNTSEQHTLKAMLERLKSNNIGSLVDADRTLSVAINKFKSKPDGNPLDISNKKDLEEILRQIKRVTINSIKDVAHSASPSDAYQEELSDVSPLANNAAKVHMFRNLNPMEYFMTKTKSKYRELFEQSVPFGKSLIRKMVAERLGDQNNSKWSSWFQTKLQDALLSVGPRERSHLMRKRVTGGISGRFTGLSTKRFPEAGAEVRAEVQASTPNSGIGANENGTLATMFPSLQFGQILSLKKNLNGTVTLTTPVSSNEFLLIFERKLRKIENQILENMREILGNNKPALAPA